MTKLYLSKDKKLAGVCGGIAEYFDIDSSMVRLAWVILSVLTGIIPGIIAYIVAALIIPPAPETV
jgi:phage shock protein PspC (stress-responsive transcriptional regulator)